VLLFRYLTISACLLASLAARAQAAEQAPITYADQIRPILRQHCFKCHGEDEQKSDLNLSTYASVLKGGSAGGIVTAGRPSASLLFEAITQEDPAARMPPNSPPLAA